MKHSWELKYQKNKARCKGGDFEGGHIPSRSLVSGHDWSVNKHCTVQSFPRTQTQRGRKVKKEFDGLQNLNQTLRKALEEPEGRSGPTEPGRKLSSSTLFSFHSSLASSRPALPYWVQGVDRKQKLQSSACHKWQCICASLASGCGQKEQSNRLMQKD